MNKKQFQVIQLLIVLFLAIIMAISIFKGISFLPPLAIVISAFLINFLYHRVDEVVADERDYKIAGKSARVTFTIVSLTLATLGASFSAYGIKDPYFYKLGYLLLHVVSFMLVTNILVFAVYQKRGDK